MLYLGMSAEYIKNSKDENNHLKASVKNNIPNPKRVDINQLLNRVRKEQEKKNRTNLIFLGLIFSLIFVVGIILSL